jgi:hypothetical protein
MEDTHKDTHAQNPPTHRSTVSLSVSNLFLIPFAGKTHQPSFFLLLSDVTQPADFAELDLVSGRELPV